MVMTDGIWDGLDREPKGSWPRRSSFPGLMFFGCDWVNGPKSLQGDHALDVGKREDIDRSVQALGSLNDGADCGGVRL